MKNRDIDIDVSNNPSTLVLGAQFIVQWLVLRHTDKSRVPLSRVLLELLK